MTISTVMTKMTTTVIMTRMMILPYYNYSYWPVSETEKYTHVMKGPSHFSLMKSVMYLIGK